MKRNYYVGDRYVPYKVHALVEKPKTPWETYVQETLRLRHEGAFQYTKTFKTGSLPIEKRFKRNVYKFPLAPLRVLDAPQLSTDFYTSTIAWGAQNMLAIALGGTVYLYNFLLQKIVDESCLHISTIRATGWKGDRVLLYATNAVLFSYNVEHGLRYDIHVPPGVTTIKARNERLVAVAFRDGVGLYDFRTHRANTRGVLEVHHQRVCGIEWSPHNENYILTGGNDNTVALWDIRRENIPFSTFRKHTAAVRGMAWYPTNSCLFCTGGGSACMNLYVWNIYEDSKPVKGLDVKGQVCNVFWGEKYILTTEGYRSNGMNIWSYPSLENAACIFHRTDRLLQADMSPDKQYIAVGSGEEAIWIWKVFNQEISRPRKDCLMPVIR